MSGFIIRKVLKKVGIFFNNFSEDNVDIQLLKGQASIKNIGIPC